MAAPRTRKRTVPPPPKGYSPPYLTVSGRTKKTRTYRYVVLRYDEIQDDGRKQPKPLVSLGREEQVDRPKAEALTGVMREFVRKGSTMTLEEPPRGHEGRGSETPNWTRSGLMARPDWPEARCYGNTRT